jgi:antibiotic biosynthesis monooxygenase (ABM) superfamily enzyme
MIERHVTFHVLPDRAAEFRELFVAEYRPAMAAMPGYVKVELLCDQQEPAHHMMVIRFESLESAAAWRSSEAHQSLKPRIGALYDGSTLKVYDVVA